MDLTVADQRVLGKLVEVFDAGQRLEDEEFFEKPNGFNGLRAGFFRLKDSEWIQKFISEVPSLVKHEVNIHKSSGFWLTMQQTAFKVAMEAETEEEGMKTCLTYAYVFVTIWRNVLLRIMDYCLLKLGSAGAFAAQMYRSVDSRTLPMDSRDFY